MKFIDLMGMKFERLAVVKEAGRDKNKKVLWDCVCDCGNEKTVVGGDLKSGKTRSCGCLQSEVVTAMSTKHGNAKRSGISDEYKSWCNMIQRCTNPSATQYEHWGGRGIKVCDRWLNSFENFINDMGKRPTKKHSIDRIDVNGDYEPDNCHWITNLEQQVNKRTPKTNKSGTMGVSWHKRMNKWHVRITINHREKHIGYFENIEDAIEARKQAETKYHTYQPS
jgi:hypothetical protein